MPVNSTSEENYLKALYHLYTSVNKELTVTELASEMKISAPSATHALQRLSEKKLVQYEKHKPFKLTKKGETLAKQVIRKHRLWELFLVNKMGFKWDEVHEIAEQLEHVQSAKLIERIDEMLNYPKFDPHGDPIPDANGNIPETRSFSLTKGKIGENYQITGVTDHSTSFMNYLENINIGIGKKIKLVNILSYDGSVIISRKSFTGEITLSNAAAQHLQVEKV